MKNSNKLIVVNGGYKTGSTLLFSILSDLFPANSNLSRSIYNSYNIELNKSNLEKLHGIVACKSHIPNFKFWDNLKSTKYDIIFIITKRELYEQLNSYYFHWLNEKKNINWFFPLCVFKSIEMMLYEKQVINLSCVGALYNTNFTKDRELIVEFLNQLLIDENIEINKKRIKIAINKNLEVVNSKKFGGNSRSWFLSRNGKKYSYTIIAISISKIIICVIPSSFLIFIISKFRKL